MSKVYYLKNCSTCKRILKEVLEIRTFECIDIKENSLSEDDIDEMAKLAGNYESIFNKQARKYRELGLNKKDLKDEEFRDLLYQEYTFLKRPVFLIDNKIFAGNSKKNINELINYIQPQKG